MEFQSILSLGAAFFSLGLALFVLYEDPRSFSHCAFAAAMLPLALREIFSAMMAGEALPVKALRWESLGMQAAAFVPAGWLLFGFSLGESDVKAALKKWKGPLALSLLLPVAASVWGAAVFFRLPAGFEENPLSAIPLALPGYLFYLFYLVLSVWALVNVEGILRGASGSKRWRIKLLLLGLGGVFAVEIYAASQTLLFSSVDLSIKPVQTFALIAANVLIWFSLIRYRLLDLKIYPSQAVIYNSITLIAVGAYLVIVGLFAKVIDAFGGRGALPWGAFFIFIALLGLSLLLLSEGIRQRVKRFISRNFYRARYDYRKEWGAFTQRTSSILDIKDLCSMVCRVASETFGVSSVTIWLTDESKEVRFGGSTVFSDSEIDTPLWTERWLAGLAPFLQEQSEPVDFHRSSDPQAKGLRESYPADFEKGRVRYAAPLLSNRQFLGWMTLNDRPTGEPFSVEDIDLLKTMADQSAATLLNLQWGQHLSKLKEREAFHAVSTFFIHDLKNLASMLSLTMQNLPVHFDNPAFRQEALRVISQSVAKMNAMCSRLSLVTKQLELRRTEVDLNDLVRTTLGEMSGSIGSSLIEDLHPLPNLEIDPEQFQKVLVNLILNANEATGQNGEIRVTTKRTDRSAVLSVQDNGYGIPEDFMKKSLFQPFQTTKSEGLGIGLYHSKKIVEAHHGQIEVESRVGSGTTFRVILPMEKGRV